MATRSKIRVLHVIGALVAGGAERFVVDLARHLSKEQCVEVHLFAMSGRIDPAGQEMRQRLLASGVSFTSGPTEKVNGITLLWYTRQVGRINPDIIHLHTPNTELLHYLSGFIGRQSAKLVRTLHNTEQPNGLIMLAAYKRNRADISISCGVAVESASRSIVNGRLQTIVNGVDFSYPTRTKQSSFEYRHLLGIDKDGFHVLHVGRMAGNTLDTAAKAHDLAIRAWIESGIGRSGSHLHFLGDGSLRSELVTLARDDSSIHFHGVRSDVFAWFLACDYFLMPSRFEGMPIAGIEAIGAGLPCIFSDIAPLRELQPPVADWAPVDDVSVLAKALNTAAVNRIEVSGNDVESFRVRFSIRTTAEKYAAVYRSIIPEV